ncbi:MAG: gfo/Idh/MocA family oxidoreductase [Proteobacteria bacterium]|nr:gfo/Idh/MocA family oxidoreductase [Pseudomonadota bacterium]
MRVLVVGYGSIGQRHARLLMSLGAQVAVLSSQQVGAYPVFAGLAQALSEFAPEAVVVANVTSQHGDTLARLAASGFTGKVLVEKPVFMHLRDNTGPYPFRAHVAYQLRFHPVVRALKAALRENPPYSAHIYVGQHLSQWRPGRDVKQTYSAHYQQGGGVVRDLSHELDLIHYLFGEVLEARGLAARVADITVDSEDVAALLLECASCPVISLQMNYLDHIPRREMVVTALAKSFKADMIARVLHSNDQVENFPMDSDAPYLAMHQAWLAGDDTVLCTLDEGIKTLRLIESVVP